MESWLSRALERQDGDIARISDLRKRAPRSKKNWRVGCLNALKSLEHYLRAPRRKIFLKRATNRRLGS